VVQISREAPAERRAVAVAVLADLVRLGQSSEQALARVSGAVLSSAALASLHAEVASQLRLGGLSSTLDATGYDLQPADNCREASLTTGGPRVLAPPAGTLLGETRHVTLCPRHETEWGVAKLRHTFDRPGPPSPTGAGGPAH
jgi:hypothetical protein